jgi:glycosyltransferase involved in cell wall biosynthesis
MKIGISRNMSASTGGGFQYEISFLNALAEIAPRSSHELSCLTFPNEDLYSLALEGGASFRGLPMQAVAEPTFTQGSPDDYVRRGPPRNPPLEPNTLYVEHEKARRLRQLGIDLILQLSPNPMPFWTLMPFVMPIWDLNHRLQPQFPEVSAHGETEWRDYLFGNACRTATLILVESEQGKSDVLRFYGHVIDADRIRVLPLYPSIRRGAMPTDNDVARVLAKYRLPPRYFFYPAQFWRHKNHELIVRALRLIADETGERIPVAFCGSYVDYHRAVNFVEVMKLADSLGLREQVHYLGLTPNEDMPALYRASAGLVMPTFFGPTNLPPLEAWHYGRPVITSDIPGLREQTGDAGLLIDPRSAPALAQAMLKLWRDDAFGRELAERGRRRLGGYDWPSYVDAVAAIVDEAAERVRQGRTPRYPPVEGL